MGVVGEGPFIAVAKTHYCNISGNSLSQLTAGIGVSGIVVAGSPKDRLNGALVVNNQIAGGWNTGANSLAYGITFEYCNDCNGSNNTVVLASRGSVNTLQCTGKIITDGTTNFPRSGNA